ncbi:unnamed protein product [Rhizoctonia solani]|uniref:Zn(2)-C6 fungal-type domain-containing protein n=1 Tax=Rhizoctonia solani TaxID=456999 RepID=A0A8H2W6V3_9AGAM|nr:unnamed protein product [Rhizoctonia solani]
MSDMDLPVTQHPSLTNLEPMDRYDMYDTMPPSTGASTSFGDTSSTRPKRKQVKNACSACQRACKRCDVGRPCERCIKYGMADSCRDSQRKERKKGIKRGPYKKRDGEYLPHGPDRTAHPSLGMINELQRLSPKRMSVSRASGISEVDLSATSLIQIDVDPVPAQQHSQAVSGQIQPVPARTNDQYPYHTPVMMSQNARTPPLSLAGMHQQPHQHQHQQSHNTSNSNSQSSSSYPHSEDQYYQRYDPLAHAPARSAHYRVNGSCSQPSNQQDYSRHAQPMQDYTRSPAPALQYPSPDQSPPRERQYTNSVYQDNSSRHSMVQSVHHDHSYQSQSDQMAHDHESHDPRTMDSYYATQQQQQRGYSSEGHMSDVHQSQQDPQQQQQSYYQSYNAYQQSPANYGSSQSHTHQQQYGYSQSHVPQQQAMGQGQTDTGYSQHLNYSSAGSSSINSYPTQPHQQVNDSGIPIQYSSTRSPMKMVHRGSINATAGMVAHPQHHSHHPQQHHAHTHHHHQHHSQHVGNVQVQSN